VTASHRGTPYVAGPRHPTPAVEQQDGVAFGEALYRVLTEPGQAQRMRAEAARLALSAQLACGG
jgi:hypothetical protein